MIQNNVARIAVFISGGGTNLQALIDASKAGILSGEIVLVISSSRKAYGLVRAEKAGIDRFVYRRADFSSDQEASGMLIEKLKEYKIDCIALTGYLKLLPEQIVDEYKGRILNIHPALLPKFGGKGMYGHHVHKAVIEAGEKESGITIHLVDKIYDNGKILKQVSLPILDGDTPETLAERILKLEHTWYARVLNQLIKNDFQIEETK